MRACQGFSPAYLNLNKMHTAQCPSTRAGALRCSGIRRDSYTKD